MDIENAQFGYKTIIGIVGTWVVTNLSFLQIDNLAIIFIAGSFTIDLITGIWKSIAMRKFSSNVNFTRILVKVLFAAIVVLFSVGIQYSTGANPKILVTVIFSALAFNDLLSAIGNLYTILTKEELPEKDILPLVISLLHQKLYEKVSKLLEKLKK